MFNRPLAGAQAAGSPVPVEIDRRSEPDAVGNLQRLIHEPLE
jgi:hypothetical protein